MGTAKTTTMTRRTTTRRAEPATPKELLDQVEAEALQGIADAVLRVKTEVCEDGLRRGIRRHPLLAIAVGLTGGFVLGPLLPRLTGATSRALLPLGALAGGVIKEYVRRFVPSGR